MTATAARVLASAARELVQAAILAALIGAAPAIYFWSMTP